MNTSKNLNRKELVKRHFDNLSQSFIEKNLRKGKIKVNNKKTKSSYKVKTNDEINLFNFKFEEKIIQKKIGYNPSLNVIPPVAIPIVFSACLIYFRYVLLFIFILYLIYSKRILNYLFSIFLI